MATSDNGELNRSIGASNTSDPNNSLLQKVTKRVSGLIPTSLTKWFGPSEGTHAVVRRRESEDEDDTDSSQVQPPPKKRVKLPTDVEYSTTDSYSSITSASLVNTHDLRHLQPGPSGYNARQTSTELYEIRSEPFLTATNVSNGDDRSDSGESTSGYSSVPAQQHKESFSENTSTSLNKSLNLSMNSTRSLFSEQSLNPNRSCMSARRPTFNASTFGSPSFVDRTLSTKRAVNSPFYGGRTMYGGANAYRRNRIIFPRDESNNIAVKNSINMKPINESTNESVSLSKTARRILDTLEHFSTPVLDAKKIPSINKPSISESAKLNQRRTLPYSREKASTRELLVPGIPDLLKMKMKERLQNSTEQVRKVATTSKSVLNKEYSIRTVEEDAYKPLKHTSKMKSKLVQVRQKKNDSNDVIDAVQLPEVKLPITNLPKFDFTLPPPPTVVLKKSPGTSGKATSKLCQPIQKAPLSPYQFASPIILNHTPKSITSINNFKFSEPLDSKSNPIPAITFKSSGSTAPRKKESKNNGQNETHVGLQPPKEFVSGSVMDILGPAKSKVNSKKPVENLDKFKPATGTWACNACMVRNENDAIKCVACETPIEPAKTVQISTGWFGDKFKPAPNTWECSACMVRNNTTETKCIACTTPKTTVAPVASKPIAANSNSFGAKFRPAANTWECTACLVRNEVESTKCIACETPKLGTKIEAKSSLVMPPDLITKPGGFGDLIQKQQSNWECGSCMVRNPPEKNACVCCETAKPGTATQTSSNVETKPTGTQFKFGIDKASTQADGFQFGAAKTNSAPSTGFKFGTDKALNPSPATFTFGIKPAETLDSVPTSTIVSNSTTAFTFGVSKSKALTPSKSEIVNTVTSTVNKTPISTSSTTNTETLKTFTFGTGSPSTFAVTPFAFGTVSSTTTQNTTAKPTFSFGATATTTTPVATSTTVPVNVSSTTPSSTTSNIFGNTAPIVAVTTISFVTTTASATPTFTFGNAAPAGADSIPVQQFNFGASLPFNPTYPSKTVTATTSTTTSSFASTFASTSSAPSSFASQPPTLNLNNTKNKKPFGFTSGEPIAKIPAFSFAAPTEKAAAPLAKAPVYSFGAPSGVVPGDGFNAPAPPNATAGLFGFNTAKTEKPSTFGGTPIAHTVSPMFGVPPQQAQTPQNGGFNFGAPNAAPSFNFGAGAVTTPAVFGFGANQAGTGSAAANSTVVPVAASSSTAGGVFAFGQQQQQRTAFSPDIKPNFNFTTNSPAPNFIPQGGPSQTTLPQRRIRKAIRRTQPR